jgi:hypothetical protein
LILAKSGAWNGRVLSWANGPLACGNAALAGCCAKACPSIVIPAIAITLTATHKRLRTSPFSCDLHAKKTGFA